MANKMILSRFGDQAMIYRIRLQGHLSPQWSEWFAPMKVNLVDDGETVLTGPVIDQAALHGLLRKVRDLGMPLLAVYLIGPDLQGS
ncbi:MAG: hypothetical protein R2824_04600 [Saprospiraceae bacterium]|nr:hypothetical protein [Lewinella sp.]